MVTNFLTVIYMSQPRRVVQIDDDPPTVLGQDEKIHSNETIAFVPPKSLLNANMKGLKGYRDIRKSIKQNSMKQEFVLEMKKCLKLIDNPDNKYDTEILQFVIECAEHYFVSHSKMGDIKKAAVVECVKDIFFDNNEIAITKMIELILPRIIKTNVVIRNKNVILNFFSSLVKKLL